MWWHWRSLLLLLAIVTVALLPFTAHAQSSVPAEYGRRILSKDGKFLSPVASNMLWSDDDDHIARGRENFNAWDWAASVGSPIFGMADGVVELASTANEGGYGHWVFVNYGTVKAVHAHCKAGSLEVSRGDKITAWTVLCQVGMTGSTAGPHTHLEIRGINGGRLRVDGFFDRSLMTYCKFCNSSNDPVAGIYKQPTTTQAAVAEFQSIVEAMPSAATSNTSTKSIPATAVAFYRLAQLPATALAIVAIVYVALLLFFGSGVRNTVAFVSSLLLLWGMTTESPAYLARQESPQVTSAAPPSSVPASEQWKKSYQFAMRWEGKKCTNDGAYTMAGVTQGAYNKFRNRHGLPKVDVCQNLTEAEREQIAYEDYWVASGADKLAWPLNIMHFDFAFNAGAGKGGAPDNILKQCGSDAQCYSDKRVAWYKTRKACNLYCGGWLNRVADLNKVINQGSQVASN